MQGTVKGTVLIAVRIVFSFLVICCLVVLGKGRGLCERKSGEHVLVLCRSQDVVSRRVRNGGGGVCRRVRCCVVGRVLVRKQQVVGLECDLFAGNVEGVVHNARR